MVELDLIVMYSNDIECLRPFYEILGVTFVLEQHGSGPMHYAGQLGQVVLELYPTQKEITRLRLGFSVDDIASVIASLDAQYVKQYIPQNQQATLLDPEGRKIELRQKEGKS